MGKFRQTALRHVRGWWLPFAGALILGQTALSLLLRPGIGLTTFATASQFIPIVLAAAVSLSIAAKSSGGRRLFWGFLSAGYGLWSVSLWLWIYYEAILRKEVPDSSISDTALFLHIVPMMGAVAVRPHLRHLAQRLYRRRVNFLVLLFFWVFVYAYFLFPYQYLFWDAQLYHARYHALYFVENFVLLAFLGGLIWPSPRPWKAIYFHLWGASFLYGLSSLIADLALDEGRYYPGSLYDVPLLVAICWFTWVPFYGRKTVFQDDAALQPETRKGIFSALVARFSVLAIPVLGAWELFRSDGPPGLRSFRLLVVLTAVVMLAVCAFVLEHLSNRELLASLSEQERLVGELQASAHRVKQLSGLLPICAACKKIRDDSGNWQPLEQYVRDHSEASFSHGMCPECFRLYYPNYKYTQK